MVRELITMVLESYFLNKKPFLTSFDKFKSNIKISKLIQQDTNMALIQNNVREIVHFMIRSQHFEGAKDVAKELCKVLTPLSRSFVGKDLVNLFKIMGKYSLTDIMLPVLINVAPNLMTIESQNNFLDDTVDKRFIKINERIKKQDLDNKKIILKKYEHLYHHKPELLKKPEASLSPLSYLMTEVLDEYTDDEVLVSLFVNIFTFFRCV